MIPYASYSFMNYSLADHTDRILAFKYVKICDYSSVKLPFIF